MINTVNDLLVGDILISLINNKLDIRKGLEYKVPIPLK